LGLLALLIGLAGIVAAIRTRRRRRYSETYASSGGIVYTIVQVGCSGLLLVGGVILMTLALIFRR
jgi:hypothetical protein